jgi:hypothetical protein
MSTAFPGPDELDGELSDDLRSRVKAELDPGERLLWVARPIFKPPPLRGVFIGAVVAGVYLLFFVPSLPYLIAIVINARDAPGALILGLGLFLIWFVVLLYTLGAWRHRKVQIATMLGTIYALTDHRAITWIPTGRKGAITVSSFPSGTLKSIHRIERPDGSGDVLFNASRTVFVEDMIWEPPGFRNVADVRQVERHLRRILTLEPERTPVP